MSTSDQTTTAPATRPLSSVSGETREALARALCLDRADSRDKILDAAIRNAIADLTALAYGNDEMGESNVQAFIEGLIARLNAACDLGDWALIDAERGAL